jgi:GTP-binding protein SAR1
VYLCIFIIFEDFFDVGNGVLSLTTSSGSLASSKWNFYKMAIWLDWLRDLFSSLLTALGLVNKNATIILVGLDNAGKTTLLNRLASGTFGAFAPTVKPTHNEFKAGSVTFRAWDLGGHEAVRQLWEDFLPTTDGVVFLVDSADPDRIAECEEELSALAADDALFDVPIAVLYNKTDLAFALGDEELRTGLDWEVLERREGPIQGFRCSVLQGTGYTEAFQWLSNFC